MAVFDEEKFEDERREHKRKLIMRVMTDAQEKYEKYFNEYQSVGGASQLRTARKYEDLVTICSMALGSLDQSCDRCLRRYRNGKSIVERLKQTGVETVSTKEAIEMIENASSL